MFLLSRKAGLRTKEIAALTWVDGKASTSRLSILEFPLTTCRPKLILLLR